MVNPAGYVNREEMHPISRLPCSISSDTPLALKCPRIGRVPIFASRDQAKRYTWLIVRCSRQPLVLTRAFARRLRLASVNELNATRLVERTRRTRVLWWRLCWFPRELEINHRFETQCESVHRRFIHASSVEGFSLCSVCRRKRRPLMNRSEPGSPVGFATCGPRGPLQANE